MKEGLAVAPCPNWYQTNAVSVREVDSIYATASFKNVVAYKLENQGTPQLNYLRTIFHSSLKVMGISLYPDPEDAIYGQTIAVALDNGAICVVNIISTEILYQYVPEKTLLLNSLCWGLVDDEPCICGVGNEGLFLVWCPKYSSSNIYTLPGKKSLTVIQCVPHRLNEAIIASDMSILHINIKGAAVKRQFKGHTCGIYCIKWQSDKVSHVDIGNGDMDTDDQKGGLYFASSDHDRNVIVWNFFSDTYLAKRKVPILCGGVQKYVKEKSLKYHVCLTWKEDELFVTTPHGEIILLSYDKQPSADKLISHPHKKVVYNINRLNGVLITSGQEKSIIGVCEDSGKILFNIPAQCVNFCTMAFHPQDPTRLAIGAQDGCIDLLTYFDGRFECQTICRQMGKVKIYSLSWHPTCESKLLFGTSEGQVGICDLNTRRTSIFAHHHKRSTYTVHWAPSPMVTEGSEDNFYAYSFGDKEILIRNPTSMNEAEPENLLQLAKLDKNRSTIPTDFSFSPDYKLVTIGYKNGVVEIIEMATLKVRAVISVMRKTIQHLVYKPFSTTSTKYVLAVGTGESNISLFNLPDFDSEDNCIEITAASKELSGHSCRVVWLSWSPHEDGILASASYDAKVQIWDTNSGKPLHCYGGHAQRLFRVEFCPFDPDMVLSFSEENCIRYWRPSQIKNRTQKDITATKIWKAPLMKRTVEALPVVPKKTPAKKTYFPLFHTFTSKKKYFHQLCVLVLKEKLVRSQLVDVDESTVNGQTLDNNVCEETVRKFETLFKDENEMPSTSDIESYLNYFGDFAAADKALIDESLAVEAMNNVKYSCQMHCWRGSLQEKIKWCMSNKELDPFVISLAPQISFSLWEQCCAAYADQLVEKEEFVLAATYLVSIGKTEEAITVLINSRRFKEAYCIAKCRLGFSTFLINEIANSWAQLATYEGNFELATLLYLSTGNHEDAAKCMCRRTEYLSLLIGAELYKSNNSLEMSNATYVLALKEASYKHYFDKIESILLINEDLKWFKPINICHQILCAEVKFFSVNGLLKMSYYGMTKNSGSAKSLMALTIDELRSQDISEDMYPELLKKLQDHLQLVQLPNSYKQLMFYAAAIWTQIKLAADGEVFYQNKLVELFNRTITVHAKPIDVFVVTHLIFPYGIDHTPSDFPMIKDLDSYEELGFLHYLSELQVLREVLSTNSDSLLPDEGSAYETFETDEFTAYCELLLKNVASHVDKSNLQLLKDQVKMCSVELNKLGFHETVECFGCMEEFDVVC